MNDEVGDGPVDLGLVGSATNEAVERGSRRHRRLAFLAVAERLAYRAASGVTVLLVAVLGNPHDVGLYATGLLALTFIQAVGETPIRQSGVIMIRFHWGARFVRRGSVVVGVLGTLGMSALVIIATSGTYEMWGLMPLVSVPAVSTWYLGSLIRTQRADEWPRIARSQLVSSVASLVVAAPIFIWSPVAAATLQTAANELVFGFLITRHARDVTLKVEREDGSGVALLLPILLSNGISWGDSQGERVAAGAVGGSATLGLYTFALSVTRTLSDAMNTGIVNHLRAVLADAGDESAMREATRNSVRPAFASAFGVQIFVTICSLFILPHFMGHDWKGALRAIPILAASLPMTSITWSCTTALVQMRSNRSLIAVQLFGLVSSFATGVVIANDLLLGALAACGRQFVLALLALTAARRAFHRFDWMLWCVAACALIAVGGSFYA